VGGQKSLCVSLSALRLRSAVHSRQHVVCPAVWPDPCRTLCTQKHSQHWKSKKTGHQCWQYFWVHRVLTTPPCVSVCDTLRVVEKIFYIFFLKKYKIFSKKISMKFSMIFFKKKKSYEKSDFSWFFIENLLRTFFLRKKNKKMSN
jgi:hypothetical protein